MIFFDKIKRVIERPERLLIGIQLRWAYYTNNQKLLIKVLYRLLKYMTKIYILLIVM